MRNILSKIDQLYAQSGFLAGDISTHFSNSESANSSNNNNFLFSAILLPRAAAKAELCAVIQADILFVLFCNV